MDWSSTTFKHNGDPACMRDERNAIVGAQNSLPEEKTQEPEDHL